MYAITMEANKKVQYVKDYSKRSSDKKYLVEYTEDQKQAMRFEKSEVGDVITNIHNPFERVFSTARVSKSNKKQLATAEEDLS